MAFHRFLREEEALADLAVHESVGDELEHLDLARRRRLLQDEPLGKCDYLAPRRIGVPRSPRTGGRALRTGSGSRYARLRPSSLISARRPSGLYPERGACRAPGVIRSAARAARARPRPRRGRRRARRAARTGGRRGRPPPRRARSSLSASAAVTTSTASSPTFRAHAAMPSSSSSVVYEPSGRFARALARSSATAPARSTRREPVWHAGPGRPHAQEQRVAVAVVAQLLDRHRVPGGRALVPVLLPRAAPEPRLARLARAALGLGVHPREHQHAARSRRPGRSRRAGRPQAASRSGTPISRSSSRSDVSRSGSSCRIDASSAACATSSASATWRASPAPPEAITGTDTASATAARDLEVVALARAVGVDRREQDLPRAALLAPRAPTRPSRAPSRSCRRASHAAALGVDRDDDRLRAELLRELGDQARPRERRRVDRDLVGARATGAASASATERMPPPTVNGIASCSATRRTTPTSVVALLERRLHVEEDELVGAAVGVRRAELDGVADVAQPLEADALDDAAAGHVEARDQARERIAPSPPRARGRGSARPRRRSSRDGTGRRGTSRSAPRRRCPPTTRSRPASRRRRSARSSTPCRRPRPSRSAARGPRAAAPPARAGGRAPRRRRPPPTHSSASWRPRQMPSTGRPSATRARSASSRPWRAQLVHRRAAPSRRPGSTARSAPATSSTSSAPSRRNAISTERMFPAR